MTEEQRLHRNAVRRAYWAKNRTKLRASHRVWARKHREANREKIAERAKSKRDELDWFKYLLGCAKCAETDTRCLDFHHRDPTTKLDNVSHMVGSGSWRRVMIEVDKCDVLCANCHRKFYGSGHSAEVA